MGKEVPFATRAWEWVTEIPKAIAGHVLVSLAVSSAVLTALKATNPFLLWIALFFCTFLLSVGLYQLSCAKDERLSKVRSRIKQAKTLGVLELWESYPTILKRTLEDVAKDFAQDGKELVRPFDPIQLAIPPTGEIRYRHIQLHKFHKIYRCYIQVVTAVAPELAQQLPQEIGRDSCVEIVRMLEDHQGAIREKIGELRSSVRP